MSKKGKHPMIEKALENNVHKGHQEAYTIAEVEVSTETALVAVKDQEVDMATREALLDGRIFASSARLGASERPPLRSLTWLTGNNNAYEPGGKVSMEPASGLHLDMPDEDEMSPWDYELMDAMELLCEQGYAKECMVDYIDEKTKVPRKTASWKLINPSLFIVCQGIPSRAEMDKELSCRWGVAYAWPRDGRRSKLQFRCFVKELMDAGYNGAFTATFTSYCTGYALDALRNHEYVLRFVTSQRRALGLDMAEPPFYGLALPFHCSVKTATAGSEEKGGTKQIRYPISGIPRLSPRDMDAAREYLLRTQISDDQAYILEYNGFVEECVEWSMRESRRILLGADVDETPVAPREPTSVDNDNPF